MTRKMTHAEAGAIGGKAKNPNKGFGAKNPEERKNRAREAALKRWANREKKT